MTMQAQPWAGIPAAVVVDVGGEPEAGGRLRAGRGLTVVTEEVEVVAGGVRRGRRTRLCAAARTLATSRSRLPRISAKLVSLGLGQEVDRAQLQGLQGHVGSFLRQGADHDDGRLVHGQEGRQCLQARNLRHLDVERDHVRLEPDGLKHRLTAVARRADDLDLRRRAAAGPTAAGASAPSRPRPERAPAPGSDRAPAYSRFHSRALGRTLPRWASSNRNPRQSTQIVFENS